MNGTGGEPVIAYGHFAILFVRRRTKSEQRVLRLIRGDAGEHPPESAKMLTEQFGKLRDLASRNALVIHPPETPYVSPNEVALLTWLALAQRVASYRQAFHTDAMLTMMIVHCAALLDALGIRLPLGASRMAIGSKDPKGKARSTVGPSYRS